MIPMKEFLWSFSFSVYTDSRRAVVTDKSMCTMTERTKLLQEKCELVY